MVSFTPSTTPIPSHSWSTGVINPRICSLNICLIFQTFFFLFGFYVAQACTESKQLVSSTPRPPLSGQTGVRNLRICSLNICLIFLVIFFSFSSIQLSHVENLNNWSVLPSRPASPTPQWSILGHKPQNMLLKYRPFFGEFFFFLCFYVAQTYRESKQPASFTLKYLWWSVWGYRSQNRFPQNLPCFSGIFFFFFIFVFYVVQVCGNSKELISFTHHPTSGETSVINPRICSQDVLPYFSDLFFFPCTLDIFAMWKI